MSDRRGPEPELLLDLSVRHFVSGPSPFRRLQDRFLAAYGPSVAGTVIEIGGELGRDHAPFFPNATSFTVTNIDREYSEFLDVTAIDRPDESVDGYLCCSVLEHVADIHAAFAELRRTLKPGGRLVITIQFMFPIHDTVDCWRLTPDNLRAQLGDGFEIEHFAHLGARITSVISMLRRPEGIWYGRPLVYKLAAILLLLATRRCDVDEAPVGLGVVAVRR